jgi:hypothetical protein
MNAPLCIRRVGTKNVGNTEEGIKVLDAAVACPVQDKLNSLPCDQVNEKPREWRRVGYLPYFLINLILDR